MYKFTYRFLGFSVLISVYLYQFIYQFTFINLHISVLELFYCSILQNSNLFALILFLFLQTEFGEVIFVNF